MSTINREVLLRPLQMLNGVIERKQTLPILSNLLFHAEGNHLTLAATDTEEELTLTLPLGEQDDSGKTTLPARKLLEICRALPERADIHLHLEGERATLRSGKSRFVLATLPANEFPAIEINSPDLTTTTQQQQLKKQIERTQFAIAHQDVRYYLNGMLLEINQNQLTTVATDGHRMAICKTNTETPGSEQRQAIIPRKAVSELVRLLENSTDPITIQLTSNHIRFLTDNATFTSKLIEGRFPNYQQVLPRVDDKVLISAREELRQAINRASVLSNERFRSVRMAMESGKLCLHAHNTDQEEAEEELEVDYRGEPLEIGFNATYLLDALNAINEEKVQIFLTDMNSSAQIQGLENDYNKYVIMPIRL